MNLLKKKIPLFCLTNIMASLVSTNLASATYTYREEQNALAYVPKQVVAEELEPLSQIGIEEKLVIADTAPTTSVVVQREVTGTRNYVPARYSEVTGQAVVDYAMRYLGLRYVSAGNSLSTGTDCSGFTKLIYSEFGVYLPRTVSGQMYSGSYVSKGDLRKGDLVIYGNGGGYATHVAMYIGNGQVIHESNHRDGVKISTLYMMQYITARRVINDTAISIVEKQIEEANKELEENALNTDDNNSTENNENVENQVDENNSLDISEGDTSTNLPEVPEENPTSGNDSENQGDSGNTEPVISESPVQNIPKEENTVGSTSGVINEPESVQNEEPKEE